MAKKYTADSFQTTDGRDLDTTKLDKIIQITPQILTAGLWTLVGGIYEYNLANANIKVSSMVDIIPSNTSISIVKLAEVLPTTLSGNGTVKLYATNAPTGDIIVTLNIWN